MSELACETDWRQRILIGGFAPATLHDWPGRQTATIFLRGCPWRCAYCHNPQLQRRGREPGLCWADIEARLNDPRTALEGVVFSGGEACVDRHLPDAIAAVAAMGFRVGLHTNGAYPDRLAAILPLLDWVGFDLKTDYDHYDALTGAPGSGARASESARLIVASGIEHEFRLTWHHSIMTEEAALLAGHFAHYLGARRFVLQQFRPEGVRPDAQPGVSDVPMHLIAALAALFEDFALRRELCGLAEPLACTSDRIRGGNTDRSAITSAPADDQSRPFDQH